MSFSYKQAAEGKRITTQFKGVFDEEADLQDLLIPEGSILIIDFKEIDYINSCGVREWMRWCQKLPKLNAMELHNCPKCIVDQINFVDGFLPEFCSVESFYVPYYCEDSDKVFSLLVIKGQDYAENDISLKDELEIEGEKYELDIIKSKYLNFARKAG